MNIYHMNFGYPILDETARIYLGASVTEPRDEEAKKGINEYNRMEAPRPGYQEQCFFHRTDEPGKTFAMLHNPKRKLAVVIHYDSRECPILCEWKNMLAGDYALGLEPAASGVLGRKAALKAGDLQYIKAKETKNFTFTVDILEEEEKIAVYREKLKA